MHNKDLTKEKLVEQIIDLQSKINSLEKIVEDQKHTQDALSTSDKNLSAILEKNADGIVVVDSNGTVLYVNPAAEKLFGRSKEDFLAYPFGFPVSANKEEDSLAIIKGDALYDVEFRVVHVQWQGKPASQLSLRDITERRQAEVALTKAKEKAEECDRLKTAFLHNISHEIRTPMNAIVGFSGFLNDPDLPPDKRKEFTDIIIQSSDQLLSIITDIVSIASIEAGQEKIQENEININLICKLIYEQFFAKTPTKNVLICLKDILADEEVNIITDATKLTQILTNLIGNALKFTQQGYVNFGYVLKDGQLEFYVEDSGIGISLDMQEVIFNRFRQVETIDTRKYGGSGLGLSISKAYVEMLGGRMWLTSELDKGSVFYFTIPYKKVNPKKLPDIHSIKGLRFEFKTPKTILIAEDEDSNFMLLEELLSNMGISIIRAVNGLEAVELCKSNPHINLVLMDIKMPDMDGYEATMRIKEFKPDLYIIAQTAYSTEADKNKAFACGCSDFMSKPLKRELLLSKINEQLLK